MVQVRFGSLEGLSEAQKDVVTTLQEGHDPLDLTSTCFNERKGLYRQVSLVTSILHAEPSLDALSLRSDAINSTKILSSQVRFGGLESLSEVEKDAYVDDRKGFVSFSKVPGYEPPPYRLFVKLT